MESVLGTAMAVRKRYSEDSAGFVAAGITYYAFLSLFPLMLLALAGFGYALAAHPEAQAELTQRVSSTIPGLGETVGRNVATVVRHRAGAGIVGLAGLVWSGRGVAAAASHGLARVFRFEERAGFVVKQVWLVASLAALGVLALASASAGAAVASVRLGVMTVGLRIAGTAVTIALDFALFLAAYRLLTLRHGPDVRQLWPGALFSAAGWTALKVGGGWYAARTVAHAEAVYGTFAATVGVLVLLSLASQLFMYGAELNAVLIASARKTETARYDDGLHGKGHRAEAQIKRRDVEPSAFR